MLGPRIGDVVAAGQSSHAAKARREVGVRVESAQRRVSLGQATTAGCDCSGRVPSLSLKIEVVPSHSYLRVKALQFHVRQHVNNPTELFALIRLKR